MPGYRDWTPEEQALIDSSYNVWLVCKDSRGRGKNVIMSAACRLLQNQHLPDDANAPPLAGAALDAALDRRWPQEIGKYYNNRFKAENGRPRAQRKTPEQLEILTKVFRKTGAYPYTGEMIAAAFLTGLELKQVKSWLENERKKYLNNDPYGELDFWLQEPEQDSTDAKHLVRGYSRDREGYARELVFGKRDVRTGKLLDELDPAPRKIRCRAADSVNSRVSLVKYWNQWEQARAGNEANAEDQEDEQEAQE